MKKIKSIISLLLAAAMILAVAAAGIGSASAAETLVEGIYQYTVTDGKATITNVIGAGENVTVPETLGGYPVTAIGKLSFREENAMHSIVIPRNVETIEESAFTACTKLESVTFENNSPIKAIPKTAFNNNFSLKTVNFGENSVLEVIGESAFYGCESLEVINFPETLKSIGSTAFENCKGLKDVTITKNVNIIGEAAFSGCESLEAFKVDSSNAVFSTDSWGIIYNKDKTAIFFYPAGNKRPVYTIPAYITYVQNSAFKSAANLEEVSWLNPETSFGLSVFSYCTNLYRVTVPEGTKHLADWMFNACFSLTEVNLPDSVGSFGAGVFHWCTNLKEFVMPASLEEVTSNSFKECFNLRKVVLNDSLKFIGPNAFSRCFALEEINLHENIKQIGNTAFYQCYSLKEITFPSKVRNINYDVLRYCYGLESVTLSEETDYIETNAFMDCRALEAINIPASVYSMLGDTFNNCVSLKEVNVDPENTKYKTGPDGVVYTVSGRTVMYYPAAKEGSIFVMPDSVDQLQKGAFISAQNLASIVIPASVTTIRDSAFDGYNIRDIYYEGTEEQWNKMQVADDEVLKNITLHFNHKDGDHVHDYAQKITVTPTCEKMGQKQFTCPCGESVTVDWHYASSRMICADSRFILTSETDSDCTTKGKYTFDCSVCGKDFDNIEKAKLGHDFEVSVSDTKVNYRCKDCNHSYDEPIPEGSKYAAFVYPDKEYVYILNPGEKLGYPTTPVKDGLDFACWIDDAGVKVNVDVMPDRNVVLHPFFEKHMEDNAYGVTVKFDENCFAEGSDVELVIDDVDNGREQGAILVKDADSVFVPIALMDISFTHTNSEGEAVEVQPQMGKTVELCIPVPEGYEYCEKFLVYHRHGGRDYDEFFVTPVDGKLIFTVDRFSEFEIFAQASITLNTLPDKINYSYKEEFDPSGLTLSVIDALGKETVIDDVKEFKITGFDPKKVGTQTVTVEYEGIQLQFNVTVSYTWWQMLIRFLFFGFLWY